MEQKEMHAGYVETKQVWLFLLLYSILQFI